MCAYCKRSARWHPTRNTPSTTRFDLWSLISSISELDFWTVLQIFSAESIAEVALSLARFYSKIFEKIWLTLIADCAISETLRRPEIDGLSPLLVHIFELGTRLLILYIFRSLLKYEQLILNFTHFRLGVRESVWNEDMISLVLNSWSLVVPNDETACYLLLDRLLPFSSFFSGFILLLATYTVCFGLFRVCFN